MLIHSFLSFSSSFFSESSIFFSKASAVGSLLLIILANYFGLDSDLIIFRTFYTSYWVVLFLVRVFLLRKFWIWEIISLYLISIFDISYSYSDRILLVLFILALNICFLFLMFVSISITPIFYLAFSNFWVKSLLMECFSPWTSRFSDSWLFEFEVKIISYALCIGL